MELPLAAALADVDNSAIAHAAAQIWMFKPQTPRR